MERSQLTYDEELYRPYLLQARDTAHFLRWAHHWGYFCNAQRAHLSQGIEGESLFGPAARSGLYWALLHRGHASAAAG